MNTRPLNEQQLNDIATRAAHLHKYATQDDGEGDTLAGQDVPALIAEIRRQRAALTTLADRWEQHADTLTAGLPTGFYARLTPAQERQTTRAHAYRKAAADVRDVLRTGRIPHDLMTDAELEQHGAPEEALR